MWVASRRRGLRPLVLIELPSDESTAGITLIPRKFNVQHIDKVIIRMALVSGPGRGGRGGDSSHLPDELQLAVDAHVKYIQSLDTVRTFIYVDMLSALLADTLTAKR